MSLAWKVRRLRVMGPPEIAHRLARAGRMTLERVLYPTGWLAQPPTMHSTQTPGRPWLSLDPGAVSTQQYLQSADAILAGRMDLFSSRRLEVGFPPEWNREPTSGIVTPLSFGKSLDYRDPRRVGDVKYVWEINRHAQLVTLAQAWHLGHEDRHLQGCRVLLDSWIEQCPCPLGLNWSSSLEPAMRLVNWSAAWFLLGGEDSPLFRGREGEQFRVRWMRSVWQHCHFIAGNLSRHSSANNHLLGELLGLYVGASTWPLWPQSGQWLSDSREEFESQALKQNAADGVNREQAIHYHLYVLEMMMVAGLVSRASSRPFDSEYWLRMEHMMEVLASLLDSGGNMPQLGDEDGAIVIRLTAGAMGRGYRPMLAQGAALFGRADFRFKAGTFDDQGRWLLGREAQARFDALAFAGPPPPPRRDFRDGGWYVLGDRFETVEEVRMVVDAAPLGYLGIAAHGHADALAATLSVGGEEVLIDCGTYGYYVEPRWRDYFRGTSAHNTVRVDGVDQSVSGGAFLWMQHATAVCEEYSSDDGHDCISAAHDGYERLTNPVTHRRRIDYAKANRLITIEDEIRCTGQHLIETFWHIPRERLIALEGHRMTVRTTRHVIAFELPTDCQVRLVQGGDQPLLGWRSPHFGKLEPCHTLVATIATTGPWRGITRVRID